jgi:hypothetical protein
LGIYIQQHPHKLTSPSTRHHPIGWNAPPSGDGVVKIELVKPEDPKGNGPPSADAVVEIELVKPGDTPRTPSIR